MSARPSLRHLVSAARAQLPRWAGGRGPFVGVYPDFDAVPRQTDGFNGDTWLRECIEEATRLRDARNQAHWLTKSRELLPLVVALLRRPGPLRVVDFGGALGVSYLLLKKRLPDMAAVEYHVIETPRCCAAGRSFFAGDPQIFFHSSDDFLGTLAPGGLLNIASSLQYVADWRGKLRSLLRWKPSFALFTQLTAGEQDTFACLQRNVRGERLGHWFFSQRDVVSEVEGAGYKLVYGGRCESALNQMHHPPRLRIGRYRNLLFAEDLAATPAATPASPRP